VKGLLGTIIDYENDDFPSVEAPEDYTAPAAFDSRTEWPDYIHSIRD